MQLEFMIGVKNHTFYLFFGKKDKTLNTVKNFSIKFVVSDC